MQQFTYPANSTSSEANVHTFLGMTAVIRSTPMQQLMRTVEKVAKSNAAILING